MNVWQRSVGIRVRFGVALVAATLAAQAFAEVPQVWQVGPLAPGDVLNLRSGPAPGFDKVGALAPGTGDLVKGVCVRLITDAAETRADRLPEWCQILQGGQPLGWAAARYLVADGAGAALPVVRPWPTPSSGCSLIGENAATNAYLDDSATLVGCPEGSAQIAEMTGARKGRIVATMSGYVLISVPR